MKKTFIAWLAEKEDAPKYWARDFASGLLISEVHSGDCTSQSHPCNLCVLENLLSEYRIYVFGEQPKQDAKQEAIAFAEWCDKNMYSVRNGVWFAFADTDNPSSGEQLYQLFKQQV